MEDARDVAILERLIEPVRESIIERGMIPLTDPQRLAIPQILEGDNVLIISPTGMGKTEAALVPIVNEILEKNLKERGGIKVLYITPLRALNRDLLDRIAWWSTRHDLNVSVRHGDTSKSERRSQALRPPDILITTPETFQIILVGKRFRRHLSGVRWIIVDELHEIAEDKRGSQLSLGLERLKMILEEEPQLIGLSATVGSPEELASFLSGSSKKCKIVTSRYPRPIEIKLVCPKPSREDFLLSERLLTHPEVAARVRHIAEQISAHESVLIFTNTRATAETLSNKLFMMEIDKPLSIHHGSLGVNVRVTAESGLKSGVIKGVVTTSSLELGIDVGSIDFVVQYGSPRQATHLLQRIGRSGHRFWMVPKGEIVALDSDDAIEALVVRNRALRSDIEPIEIPPKPLDVLAHQILGLLFWEPRITFDKIMSVFAGGHPYRELTSQDLEQVLSFLSSRYPALINYSKGQDVISRGRSVGEIFEYYFGHVSTIPEVKHYPVIVDETKEIVGELDEEFIAEKGLVGTKFIMAGRAWSIIRISEGKVFVKEATDLMGVVPSWSGEEIPVPFEVAREVGVIRAWVIDRLKEGKNVEEIASELATVHQVDVEFAKEAISTVVETHSKGYPVATDKVIVVERCPGLTVLHACLGDRANRSLAKILGSYFSSRVGTTIVVNRDPYRVIIGYEFPPEVILDVLKGLSQNEIENLLSFGLESFGMFKRRLLHVARRFGVVEKDVDLTAVRLDDLAMQLRGTVVFDEARSELFHNDYDLDTLKRFMQNLKDGVYRVEMVEGRPPSPLAQIAISNLERKYDIFPPEKAEKVLLRYAQIRLENTMLDLVCLDCKHYFGLKRAREVGDKMMCDRCGSTNIGLVKSEDDVRLFKYRSGSRVGGRVEDFLRWTAGLLREYGNAAALVLAARGLSRREAEAILRESPHVSERLVKLILDAERKKAAKIATR
jgi:ATP-dependent Lhr-like helicase